MEDFEHLYLSHLKAQQGVIWKDSVARFSLHGIEYVLKLSNELETGTYKSRPSVLFTITKPKKREILAVSYRDRVYQRSLNDNRLYPAVTKSFVMENGACQKGRGVKYCMELTKRNLRRHYINHGLDGYILQIDIKGYYSSMSHEKVKAMFRKVLDDETYQQVAKVLDDQYGGDTGFNPGSQMVQIAGIGFLNGLDHFIKEKLHIKNYVRIMDDMVIICESKEYLEYCLLEIKRELAELSLEVNPKKTKIVTLKDGITFLGFKWRMTESGKVILTPKKETIKDFRRTLEKLMKLYAKGLRSRKCIEDSYQSRMAHLAQGNTYQLRRKLEKWFAERMAYYDVQAKKSVPKRTCGTRRVKTRTRYRKAEKR